MLVTSRPAGLSEPLFAKGFYRLRLGPLSDAQQMEVIERRVGSGPASAALPRYVREKVPLDAETGQRVTGNPLMLSVVISIFQSRQAKANGKSKSAHAKKRDVDAAGAGAAGVPGSPDAPGAAAAGGAAAGSPAAAADDELMADMPQTTVALYDLATTAVLEREGLRVARDVQAAGAAQAAEDAHAEAHAQLSSLLQAIFFEAHACQRRVVDQSALDEAALGLVHPERLGEIRSEMPPFEGRAEAGHYVEVLAGPHMGRRGAVSARPFRVRFADGSISEPLREADFRSSGLDEAAGRAFESRQRQQRRQAVRAACEQLPLTMREALRAVRERVSQDKLPLLKLLQAEPLQMQSSHLSFQEYYAARAICLGRQLPANAAAPWRWEAWWRNTLRLGAEMGDAFGRGLRIAAGESSEHLQLKSKVAGDRPTSLLAISQLMRGASSVQLAHNALTPEEALPIANGLKTSTSLQSLTLASNQLCGVWFDNGRFAGSYSSHGLAMLADSLTSNASLTRLDLSQNSLGVSYVNGKRAPSVEGLSLVAHAVGSSASLRELNVSYNSIGPQGAKAIGEAFAVSASLSALDISGNLIGLKGGKAIGDALRVNAAFTFADLRFNSLDNATKELFGEVVAERGDDRLTVVLD